MSFNNCAGTVKKETTNGAIAHGRSGCSANSFMLRDGVCDDPTNTPLCLYDGGDCCLANKATHLCRECACILNVDYEQINVAFSKYDVRALSNPESFDTVVSFTQLTVSNVVSVGVCIMICLDEELFGVVNAWHYDETLRECSCGWIDFHTDDYFAVTSFLASNVSMESNTGFVQMAKLLRTGMNGSISIDFLTLQ